MKLKTARVLYEACPLCESADLIEIGEMSCTNHPLYHEDLGSTISWRGCQSCGHVFTDGYFDEQANELLFAKALPHQTPGNDVDAARKICARIVTTVATIRGELSGKWLDVGFGNGGLMTTAQEFGYSATGIDLRAAAVEAMCDYGYRALRVDLADFDEFGCYDAVSMADVLEHMPYPKQALEHTSKLLQPGGLLFVSMPNMDSFAWKAADKAGTNPYWQELEHFHNFSRDRLYELLRETGFEPCHYAISERYRACMEVIAIKIEA